MNTNSLPRHPRTGVRAVGIVGGPEVTGSIVVLSARLGLVWLRVDPPRSARVTNGSDKAAL